MHQRLCRVTEGLSEDQVAVGNSHIDSDSSLDDYIEAPADLLEYQNIKTGILLPKRDEEWGLANNYFKSIFVDWDFTSYSLDLEAFIKCMKDSIYNQIQGVFHQFIEKGIETAQNAYCSYIRYQICLSST